MSNSDLLNEAQQQRLLANAKHADDLLANIEEVLTAAESKSPFPKYRPDVPASGKADPQPYRPLPKSPESRKKEWSE